MPVEIAVLIASFAFLAGFIAGKAVERKDWILTARSHGRHFANGHWYSVMDEATASQYRVDAHRWRVYGCSPFDGGPRFFSEGQADKCES